MDMRDKIADILPSFQDGYLPPEDVVDAIMAEMPAMLMHMIPDLVWVNFDNESISLCGRYRVYHLDSSLSWIFRAVVASFGGQYLSDHRDKTDPENAREQAKEAANAHHKAQLAKAMGWTGD